MTNEPSPRPWRVNGHSIEANDDRLWAYNDKTGNGVVANLLSAPKFRFTKKEREPWDAVTEANARLLVDAVNERDRLRAALERIARYEEGIVGCIESGHASGIDWDGITFAMIQEARAALGEGETPTGKGVGR